MEVPDLSQSIAVPEEVKQAAKSGDLIMFVGSGTSIRMGLPSWEDFSHKVLDNLASSKLLNYNEINALRALDPRKTLSIAKILAKENNKELNLVQYFRKKDDPNSNIYTHLNSIRCTFVTTNYDLYLEPMDSSSDDGSTITPEGNRISAREELRTAYLDKIGNVIHLHGSIYEPETMIVSTEEYLSHYDDENVQEFLSYLFSRKTVVFVGYGLEESELLEHILRRGSVKRQEYENKLFVLQGYFNSQRPVYEQLYRYYRNSFRLELLGFLLDFQEYHCLDEILSTWAEKIESRSLSLFDQLNIFEQHLRE